MTDRAERAGKNRLWKRILLDILCTGMALVIFALFHHVLPRKQESVGIVIQNPYKTVTEESGADSGSAEENGMLLTAAAGENSLTARVVERSATDAVGTVAENAGDAGTTGETAEVSGEMETFHPVVMLAAGERSSVTDAGTSTMTLGRSRTRNGGGSGGRSGSGSGGSKSSGMNSKGGSALTADGDAEKTAEETAADDTPLADKFADKYTDTVTVTENSYTSPDVSITVTEETTADGEITYYVADIYLRDITCFQSAMARGTYGSGYRDSISNMAALNSALVAVNGDYYGNTNEGVVIRNGVIYRANATNCDVCVLYYDGSMRVIPGSEFSVEEAIADGAWQAWTFGPALLNTDGSVLTNFDSTKRIISANPRTAIGYYEPGHYCLIVVDGRGTSAGITLPELSELFYDMGCTAAYNLDGGNSSIMVWQSEVINDPSGGGRESSDALLISEVRTYE